MGYDYYYGYELVMEYEDGKIIRHMISKERGYYSRINEYSLDSLDDEDENSLFNAKYKELHRWYPDKKVYENGNFVVLKYHDTYNDIAEKYSDKPYIKIYKRLYMHKRNQRSFADNEDEFY